MERISRDQMAMDVALTVAKRSTCLRKHVGAVLILDGRPLSWGYAGAPSGLPHCTPETCNEQHPCLNTSHAEVNAVSWAARKGIATEGATLYCTLTPCKSCADAIINAGIKRAVFKERYRDPAGLNRLMESGIEVIILP